MSDEKPEVLIVGTGAMACLFAGQLASAGIGVNLLGSWPEGLQALNRNGVRVVNTRGQEVAYPVRAESNPSAYKDMRFALVLVKSWQTVVAAGRLVDCLHPDGIALTLQNGMGNQQILEKFLGSRRVAVGSTTAGATLLGPGWVRQGGEGVITLGVHAHLKPLADLLGSAGFVVETVPDFASILWGKLVINASINPLTAILNIPNGELLQRPSARMLLATVARETAAVAVAKGYHLPFPDPVIAVEAIARRTADNLSSMLQDVLRGAPTEIDVISGAVVRAGEQTGVPTPVNRTFWLLVKSLVNENVDT